MLDELLALASHPTDRAILQERLLSAAPATLPDIGAARGVSKQRIKQRETALLQRIQAAGLLELMQCRVRAARWFRQAELDDIERTDLLARLDRVGFNIERYAEVSLIPAVVVYRRVDALGLRADITAGQKRHARARDVAEAEYLKECLAAHSYSVCAAFSDAGTRTRVYERLHDLGLVEWLVAERDRTGNAPNKGIPLVRSEPQVGKRTRHRSIAHPMGMARKRGFATKS